MKIKMIIICTENYKVLKVPADIRQNWKKKTQKYYVPGQCKNT